LRTREETITYIKRKSLPETKKRPTKLAANGWVGLERCRSEKPTVEGEKGGTKKELRGGRQWT